MPALQRPRVGHIQFLNCLPLYWGLMRSGALIDVDLHKDSPEQLNAALVAGDLDIGPISLVEYLRNASDLLLLPDIAVGSDGPVLSVNLVSTVPLTELSGRRVALGATSRTGVLLAQMYLESKVGVTPVYFDSPPDLPRMLDEADAAVIIGDVALRALHDAPQHGWTVTDLGQAWREWTGLPMVFAAWGVRRSFAAAHPGLVKDVHQAFLRSKDLCLTELDEVAEAAARWETLSAATLAHYFRVLDFSLGDRQVAGIREFAAAPQPAAPSPPSPGRPRVLHRLTPPHDPEAPCSQGYRSLHTTKAGERPGGSGPGLLRAARQATANRGIEPADRWTGWYQRASTAIIERFAAWGPGRSDLELAGDRGADVRAVVMPFEDG